MKTGLRLLVVLLVAAPCFGAELYIDLRTDYSPSTEFGIVRVELIDRTDAHNQWIAVDTSHAERDYVRGARVAEFTNVEPGHVYLIIVEVLDYRMRVVDGRMTLYRVPAVPSATMVLMARR